MRADRNCERFGFTWAKLADGPNGTVTADLSTWSSNNCCAGRRDVVNCHVAQYEVTWVGHCNRVIYSLTDVRPIWTCFADFNARLVNDRGRFRCALRSTAVASSSCVRHSSTLVGAEIHIDRLAVAWAKRAELISEATVAC